MSTEYEELVGKRQKLIEFKKRLNEEIEQAKTNIAVGQRLVVDTDRKIAEIDVRLNKIRGV